MTRKFFLFRRSDPVGPVKRISDNGKDIPILAIPADKVAFVSAGKGEINMTFNDAGIYEDNEMLAGDSIEKTNITIACTVGQEMLIIEKILIFAGSTEGKPIMKFDVLESSSPISEAVLEGVSNLTTKIKSQPTERVTQKVSTGDVSTRFLNVIGEINFGSRENRPLVDYNHESMYPVDNTDIVAVAAAEWKNAGTGGAVYDITGGTGSVTTQTEATSAAVGLSQICAQFASNSFLDVPDITVKDDYTVYFVIGDAGSGSGGEGFGVLFGDDAGETTGFSEGGAASSFSMRHDGLLGNPFKVSTSTNTSGTEAYSFPDSSSIASIGERQFCYPFVIRRDKEFNMYLYNFEGEVVAFAPAFTIKSTSKPNLKEVGSKYKELDKNKQKGKLKTKVTEGTGGRTDGNLLIQQLGSSGSNITNSFSGTLGRFGIITRDIGEANCSKLAQDLYELYKPST